jgi:DnaJ-class molecular chaperone
MNETRPQRATDTCRCCKGTGIEQTPACVWEGLKLRFDHTNCTPRICGACGGSGSVVAGPARINFRTDPCRCGCGGKDPLHRRQQSYVLYDRTRLPVPEPAESWQLYVGGGSWGDVVATAKVQRMGKWHTVVRCVYKRDGSDMGWYFSMRQTP